MILKMVNDQTVEEMHEEGLDNEAILKKMHPRPLKLTLQMPPKSSSDPSEPEVDPSIPVGKATGSEILAELKAESTYGHDSETSELLESLFMTEWNASRGTEPRDVRLQGLEATITTTTLRSWLKGWQDELAEERMVALMKEGTPADPPKTKSKRRWWHKKGKDEPPRPQRKIPFAPKPLPMGPDELAFVRLKVRSRQILADLHEGFFGGHDGHPKPVPTSLMSFLCTLVGNDFIFSSGSHWWGDGWLLPSESKLMEINPRGATRNASKPKAILLVLNFLVAKTLIHRIVHSHGSPSASANGSAGAAGSAVGGGAKANPQTTENLQLVATVIYWVTRAAMSQAFPGLTTLHSGDSAILKNLASDKAQGHVLKELQRIGWIDEQRDVLLEIVDCVWQNADITSG
jgi:hypothetical protein